MPKKIHGKKVNEKWWSEATSEAGKSYDPDVDPAKHYATAMKIYQAIAAKRKRK